MDGGHEQIPRFMAGNNAAVYPMTTREIADGCGMSVYAARYYLQELSRRHIVVAECPCKGRPTRWLLSRAD